MEHMELELAQVDRRVSAVERCVERQRELLKQHIDSGLLTDAYLQIVIELETTLKDLKHSRTRLRSEASLAAARSLLGAARRPSPALSYR
jgi:hypothetical protein